MDWETQLKLVPGGSQTRSKTGRFTDITPKTITKGQGQYIWGGDGRRMLDFTMGLGAILLGYNTRQEVNQAVNKQLERGSVFGLPSLLEGELAEQLLEYYPYYDMIRFGRNGVDATTAAVRLARAITRKMGVAQFGYAGCADVFECVSDNKRGIPNFNDVCLYKFRFNDIKSLQNILERADNYIGTVILEQPPEEPHETFYKDLAMLCRLHKVIWIQDEIVTGFRYGVAGAQGRYGFEPDLTCLSKALGNGMPISALLGKKEHMKLFNEGVSWSSTFGGELTAIAAAKECVRIYATEDLQYYTNELTERLKRELRAVLSDYATVEGVGGRLVLNFKKESDRMHYLRYMHSHNIFIMDVPIFISMAHTLENIEKTINLSGEAIESIH